MTHEYKGYKIKVEQDPDFEPEVGVWELHVRSNRYFTGDVTIPGSQYLAESFIREHRHHRVYLVYGYIHGNVVLRRGEPFDKGNVRTGDDNPFTVDTEWDTALVGFAVATRDSVREHLCKKTLKSFTAEEAGASLDNFLEDRTSIINGEVYYYTTEDADGEDVDSDGGFIGDADLAVAYAKEHIDVLEEV